MPTETADYLYLRGKTYYLRMCVPAEFADVEPLNEMINRSLKTRNNASIELLKGWGMSFSPMEDLLAGVRRALAPDRFRIDTDESARPTLRDVVIPHGPECSTSPLPRRRQLFPSRSFRTTLSSIVSPSRRFSLRHFILRVSEAWAILSFADIVSGMLIGRELGPDKQMDADLTRFIGRILGAFGALAVLLYGLGTLGVPTARIITSLGVGGVGIASACVPVVLKRSMETR